MKIYNKLLRTSFISSLSTLIKILTGMISLKIVALYTGPEGIALFGQFMSLVNIFATVAGGGITFGVIKYVAEYSRTSTLPEFLSTATLYTLFFAALTMVSGLIYSEKLAEWILGSSNYAFLIRLMAVAQIFIAIHLLFCSIINGLSQIKLFVGITIITSFLSLIMVVMGAIFYQLNGTLFFFIFSQILAIIVSLLIVRKKDWFSFLLKTKATKIHLINLMRYSFMTIVSALTFPIAQIVIRNDLNTLFGWDSVGYWQAVLRLSDAYLVFITTALTAYYLPRLSELKVLSSIKNEIINAYQILMPLSAIFLLLIYFCREIIINLLYSHAFEPAAELFFYQLLGDFFRIASWLFTYLLLAKTWTKTYILTEIFLSLIFVGLSHILARHYGLIGVTYAFALTYLVYWSLMGAIVVFYFKKEMHAILTN